MPDDLYVPYDFQIYPDYRELELTDALDNLNLNYVRESDGVVLVSDIDEEHANALLIELKFYFPGMTFSQRANLSMIGSINQLKLFKEKTNA